MTKEMYRLIQTVRESIERFRECGGISASDADTIDAALAEISLPVCQLESCGANGYQVGSFNLCDAHVEALKAAL